jgi:hypothetical protein
LFIPNILKFFGIAKINRDKTLDKANMISYSCLVVGTNKIIFRNVHKIKARTKQKRQSTKALPFSNPTQ